MKKKKMMKMMSDIDDVVDDEFEDDINQLNEADDGLDSLTVEALDVIRNTPWLDESVSNHKPRQYMQPVLETSSRLPLVEIWTDDMERQNHDIVNNVEPEEPEISEDPLLCQTEFPTGDNTDIEPSYEQYNDNVQDNQDSLIEDIIDNTIRKYSLNKKQTVAFKSAIGNDIREKRQSKLLVM